VIRRVLWLPWIALASAVFIVSPAPASIVDIGGDPIYVEQDVFSVAQWSLTLTSFVFDETSDSLPAGIDSLNPGETAFVYFLDMSNSSATSVTNFSVGNPEQLPVNTVGWLGPADVVPTVNGSPTTDTFQDPYLYGYSGPAQATVYTYSGDFFDPWCTLDPNEYSLVYYIAESGWTWVSATASSQGASANQLVPGPGSTGVVPEPSLLIGSLLGLGLLLRLRKR
jgi:hypothetical protein